MAYKLLIIDDEKLIREGLVSYLDWRSLGIDQVQTAADGVSALACIQQSKPDIILSDIRMPNMDGTQLIGCLREQNIFCEVIFISAYSEFKYAQSAVHHGAFDYLLKPITEEALSTCITKCIEKISNRLPRADIGNDQEGLQQALQTLYQTNCACDEAFLHHFLEATGYPLYSGNHALFIRIQKQNCPSSLEGLLAVLAPAVTIHTPLYKNIDVYLLCDVQLQGAQLDACMQHQHPMFLSRLEYIGKQTA